MRYVIFRHGSNAANQERTQVMALGIVEIAGSTKAARQRAIEARLEASLPGTLDATTVFVGDNGERWHAWNNQHFSWTPASRVAASVEIG